MPTRHYIFFWSHDPCTITTSCDSSFSHTLTNCTSMTHFPSCTDHLCQLVLLKFGLVRFLHEICECWTELQFTFSHMVEPRTECAQTHLVGPVHIQTRFEHRTCPKMNLNISSPCNLYLNALTSSWVCRRVILIQMSCLCMNQLTCVG